MEERNEGSGKKRGMTAGKVNWMFIMIFLVYVAVSVALSYVQRHGSLSIYPLYILNELVYLVPAFLFVCCSRSRTKDMLVFRRVKISTLLMTVLFTFLCLPLTTVVNIFTMFFVDNTVAESSGVFLQLPFFAMFFLIAVYAPVCEEVIFRGITYESLKKDLNVFQAMCLSAVLFGLAHMNFNQAAYAVLLGVILVLLREATGSLYATMLFHIVFNGYSVVLMYAQKWSGQEELLLDVSSLLTPAGYREYLLQSISIFMVLAAVTTALAGCVLAWIAGNEGRREQVGDIYRKRHEGRGRIFRISLLIVIVLYVGMMVLDVWQPEFL